MKPPITPFTASIASRLVALRKSLSGPCLAGVLLALGAPVARGQTTYTAPASQTFTNATTWNYGAGSFGTWGIPGSGPALTLNFDTFNPATLTAADDLNLTLSTLNLVTEGTSGLTLSSTLNGDDVFAGGTGNINLLGSGAFTALTAPVVLGAGETALTFTGAGASGIALAGTVSSNTSTGAPLIIATSARTTLTGFVGLNGANTFAGGVVLNSGTLALNNARALGDLSNTLMINGGTVSGGVSSGALANTIVANSTFTYTPGVDSSIASTITGAGGLTIRSINAGARALFSGMSNYTGATLVGIWNAAAAPVDGFSTLRIQGAVGSILNTSSITIRDGGVLELGYGNGMAAANTRVSAATTINIQSGYLQVAGTPGQVHQNFGTVNTGGLATLVANSTGSGTLAGTDITVADFVRTGSATAVFQGVNLGGAAVAVTQSAQQGNILFTQLNGSAPASALVGGGGGAGTTNIRILPWALGDTNNSGFQYNVGSGFVTYGANGVRVLNPATEYNTSNNFATAGATENMRVNGVITSQSAPATVNSLFFASTGQTLAGGGNTLTITSGALASNVAAATISNPVLFAAGGVGEAVVSVVGALGTANALTLSGGFTAGSLTKSGQGILNINTADAVISGGITINGGLIAIDAASRLGGATGITVNGDSQAANRAGLNFTQLSGTQTLGIPILSNAATTSISTANAATLELNSNISGPGGVTYNNANAGGVIVVAGANSYTGPTFLAGSGTVQIDGDARLGSSADPNASFLSVGGGTLQLTGTWTSARALNVSAASTLDTLANTATLSGPITGSGVLTKIGSATLTISSGVDNGYTGTITLGSATTQGGTLAFTGNGALNAASLTFGASGGPVGAYALDLSSAADIDPTDGSSTPWRSFGALNTASGFTQAHTVQLGNSAGAPVDLRVGSGTFGGSAGVIQGFGKLVKVGSGTLTLNSSVASTFTGNVEIWGGTLAFSADNELGNSANSVTLNGGTLKLPVGGATMTRTIILGATPQPLIYGSSAVTLANTIDGNGNNVALNGPINGAGGVNLTNVATYVLGAASNTYQGDTQIDNSAWLAFNSDAQLGASSSRIRLGLATLQLAASPSSATTYPLNRTIFVVGNWNPEQGTITVLNSNATLQLNGPLWSVAAAVQHILNTSGSGKVIIAANNQNFFGTFQVGNGANASGNVTLSSTGQLRRGSLVVDGLSGATFDMSNITRELGSVYVGSSAALALGASGNLITGFNNGLMGLDGPVTGGASASFTLVGGTTLSNTFLSITSNTSTFGGGFHFLSAAGGFTSLSGNGALPLQSALTIGAWGNSANRGPVFLMDNTGTSVGNRISDTQVINSNAAEIQFSTKSSFTSSETIGSLHGAGMSTITMTIGGALTFADATNGLKRTNNGAFLFRAGNANMGTAAATMTVANVTFGNSGALGLIGGGGAGGTTTISILPYAVGGITATDTGSNFVTYGANGIRVLNTTTEVNSSLFSAGATDNVRLSSANTYNIVTAGDQTINSLALAAAGINVVSVGGHSLILSSGAVLNTGSNVWSVDATGTTASLLGLEMPELKTGAGNTAELNVFTTGGDLTIGATVRTSGGLTKSGAANLYLTNAANTYTGATTINAGALVVDSLAALGGSTTLQMGGGFLKYRGTDATLTGVSIIAAGGEASDPNGGSAGLNVVAGTTLTAAVSSVNGFGGILKDGTGTLKLTGSNSYSGATIISGGALAIGGAAALGTNNHIIFADGTSSINGGQALRFDANNITLAQDFITNTTQAAVGIGIDTNGNNATLNGTLLSTVSTRGLYKFGAGNLTLTATEMYTGATQVFRGTLTLSGANGSIINSTGTGGYNTSATVLINPGASLVLDNTAANNNDRLPNVWDTPFGTGNGASGKLLVEGGELKIIGNSAGTQERMNQLDVLAGTVTLQNLGTQLVSGLLKETSSQSTGLIRGDNLGGAAGPASTNWFVTDLGSGGVQLAGAGGAKGTAFINILRGFMGDASATGTGTDFVTYAADTGFRPLSASEYTATLPVNNFDLNRAPNIALSGAATVDQTTAITALKLGAGASIGGSGTLVVAQGTILATASAEIGTPQLSTNITGGNVSLIFLTSGSGTTLTVDSALATSGVMKYGAGTLLLNGRSVGTFIVAQGTLAMGANNPFGASMTVQAGATFDLNGGDRTIGSLITTSAVGAFNFGQVSDGTIALGENRLTLYDTSTGIFTGSITGTGGLTKAFNSVGSSTFTQPLGYTGSTIVRGGFFQLGAAGTLASSSIEVRGGTLIFNNADDNAAAGSYIANRIGAGTPITLAGGTIQFTENPNTPANHNLGTITLVGGGSLTVNPGGAAPSTTTIANVTRAAAHGTLTVSGSNLGLAPSPSGNARIFLTQIEGAAPASAFIGGGGAVGTTTQSILPWGWNGTSDTFLTYGANGLRPLATSEYETNLNAPSSTNSNMLLSGTTTLTAPRTVNAISGFSTINGAFDLTVGSGALASGGVIGVNTNALLTGAGNTRELVVDSRFVMTINYNISTSGGLTKFGINPLTLGGTNTFTGGFTIDDGRVNFSVDTNLGAPGGAIRFGGTTTGAILNYGGASSAPYAFNRSVETTSFGIFLNSSSGRWQFNQPIFGAGGIGFGSSSTVFELNAANTYTGTTQFTGGVVYISNDASLGMGGDVIFNGGTLVQRGDWTTSRLLNATTTSTLVTNGFNATFNGTFTGAGLSKTGAGTLILNESMPYSGTLSLNGGGLVLQNRGSLAQAAVAVGQDSTVTLDDTGTHFSDRLNDTGNLALAAGNLIIKGNAATTTEEVIGTLALSTGPSTVTLASGSGHAAILRIAGTATNAAASATLFRGTGLGVNAPGSADTASIILTNPASQVANAFAMTGGGAPANNASTSIVKGAFGDISATGLGTQLVTYDPNKGVRLLNPVTEYTTTLNDGSVVTDNVKASGSALNLTVATTANALWLGNGASLTGTGTLTLSSGTLLVTGTGNSISAIVANGSNVFAVGGPGDVTFAASSITGTAGLAKMGAGSLTLSGSTGYSGNTWFYSGVINAGNSQAFGIGLSTLRFFDGEIRNSSGAPMIISNSIGIDGAMHVGGAQDLTFSGAVSLNNATHEINVTNTGATQLNGVISSSAANLSYGLTKTGPGLLVLGNAGNGYDGATTMSGGILAIGALVNGGSTSPLGNSLPYASNLVFDGGTLRYTGVATSTDRLFTVTQNGGTLDASGTGNLMLTNPGNIAATGSGTRTLTLKGSPTTTNTLAAKLTDGPTAADKLSLTISGTRWALSNANTYSGITQITGSTLALTGIGSFANSPAIQLAVAAAHLDVTGVTGGANWDGTRFALVAGQTLSGSGSVLGAMSVATGAIVLPYLGGVAGLGTANIFFTAATSVFAPVIDLAGAQAADELNVTGAVTISNSTLDLSGALNVPGTLTGSETFLLINNDGADPITGTFATVIAPAGFAASVNYAFTGTDTLGRPGDGNDLAISLTATPEPGTTVLLFAAAMLMAGRRRRHRGTATL